ncbi:MAG: hypothetical protein LLF89_00080 [Spirochaetaceae bacterium]|nr:hypothetical protein [Spirochaetaceae bacterium]
MLFSTGNLITLAIVIVFFIIYHLLTANNRSLEKVKRFADKRQNELDEYVDERAEELKHYGIDLDVQQKAAKIALEKLKEAQEVIAEKADSMAAIADRFKEYDEGLSKLMEMTARVDENLARIHEDEDFAESVNRKLDLAKKSMAALERELPLMRENFAQDAQKTVDSFRDDILAELQDGLASTTNELHAVRDEAMTALQQAQIAGELVDAELEKSLATAKERASSIEDIAFKTIVDDYSGKLEDMKATTDRELGELGQETSQQIRELRAAIEKFKAGWQSESATMISTMNEKYAQATSEYVTKTGTEKESLQAAIGLGKEAEARLSASTAEALQKTEASIARMEALNTDLDKAIEETKAHFEDEFAEFGQAFEGTRTRFEENFKAESAEMDAELEALKQEVARLKEQAAGEISEHLSDFDDSLLKDLSAKKAQTFKQLDFWLSDMEKTLSGITAEASARRNAEEAKYAEDFRSHLLKQRDEMYAQLEKLNESIDAVKENIQSRNVSAEAELANLEDNFKASAQGMMDDSLADIRTEMAMLKQSIENLSAGQGGSESL